MSIRNNNSTLTSLIILIVAILFLINQFNYTLYHSLAENISVVIAFGIFIVTWHTRLYNQNPFFLIIGVSYLFIGFLDFLHMLSYGQLNVFEGKTTNVCTQFWVAARLLESGSFLLATLMINKKLNLFALIGVNTAITVLITLDIFYLGLFPACFIDGEGVTLFKIISELVVITLYFLSATLIYKKRDAFDLKIVRILLLALAFGMITEFLLIFFSEPEGSLFFIGHVTKIASFILIYKVCIAVRLEEPYNTFFKDLKDKEAELKKSKRELECRVNQRTIQLTEANYELEKEVIKRKKQEAKLRNSEERFRVILKNAGLLVAHCDVNMRYTWVHSPFLNVKYDFLLEKRDDELGSDIDFRQLHELKTKVLKKHKGARKEILLKIGELEKVFDTIVEPLLDKTGKFVGLTIAAFDVTEKKQVEQTLRIRHKTVESIYAIATTYTASRETMFDQIALSIANILSVPLVVIGRIQNDCVEAITRYYKGDFTHGGEHEFCNAPCGKIFETQKTLEVESGFDSQYPKLECVAAESMEAFLGVPVISRDGNVTGSICILDDKKRRFSSIEVHLIEIFARYAAQEFEREAIQRELMQSREMQILGKLTSGVAHEVRNPLNALYAISEALFQDLGENDELNVYREHIRAQVERLNVLMKDLLDFGKPIDKECKTEMDIVEVVEDALFLWRNSDDKQKVDFKCRIPQKKVYVNGVLSKIQQVLINLLDNASQHSPSESTITVTTETRGTSKIEITVSDCGKGIELDEPDKIFEPFFTTRKKGTGLGLSIVKHTVELHKGSIKAYNSTDGQGANFLISLPCKCMSDISKQEIEDAKVLKK
ncbi:MASE3 domain-containing protein [Chitinispirillales bacterium ANBcel5]|uniref:MASE3 domain-containing protein n=1 Tax=Cellulosispirillum alkaliphilum TaxID=3039283 RepID=UPI002A4FDF30|nr:MASE3 domain-containing protein [Chitinispirillales bacterium ANBcel5]